jgi:phosphatidylserine decarboxylase
MNSCEFGPCVLVAVGASMVSSIHISASSDRVLEKGEEHGHFRYSSLHLYNHLSPRVRLSVIFRSDSH